MKLGLPLLLVLLVAVAIEAHATQPSFFGEMELAAAFDGAEKIDLRTSKEPAVVKLRDVVGIPPPSEPVLVKSFKEDSLPEVIKPVFLSPGVAGVTINSRYIAILHTEFETEYHDILQHELVHAYIGLVSPTPLPYWFHEGSAVHFSTDKPRKFYGKPSENEVGVMVGKTAELNDDYKQKLGNMHFLMEKVGKEKFYDWYKNAVVTGNVDAGELLGLNENVTRQEKVDSKKSYKLWLGLAALAVVIVALIGFFAIRQQQDEIEEI